MLIAEPSGAWWRTEKARQQRRDYNARPEVNLRKRARQKAYYYRHRERRLAGQRMINYRCTPEQYQTLLEAQGGKCAICQCPSTARFRGRIKQLAVDHDHVTGKIRALLCGGCNAGLGHFRNNPAFLLAAVDYLGLHSGSYIRHSATYATGLNAG